MVFFTPLWAHRVVYRQMNPDFAPTESRDAFDRFGLADLNSLFVYLAVANAMMLQHWDTYQWFPDWRIFMVVLCNVLSVLAWLLTVRFANSHRVRSAFKRVLVHAVFYPGSVLGCSYILSSIAIVLFTRAIPNDDPTGILCLVGVSAIAIGFLRIAFRRYIVSCVDAEPTDARRAAKSS